MEELMKLSSKLFSDNEIIQIVISNAKKGAITVYTKVNVKPFLSNGKELYQFEYFYNNKVEHKNLESSEATIEFNNLMEEDFKNADIFAEGADYQVLISKKGEVKILKRKSTKQKHIAEHNRKKEYIIEENNPVDFLVYLEVMNKEGRVHDKKRDKFKQINKFLEIVEDSLDRVSVGLDVRKLGSHCRDGSAYPSTEESAQSTTCLNCHCEEQSNLSFKPNDDKIINIIDFGCGKAYLTFALYYYLVKVKNYKVNIVGLDIKEDVIEYCNKVASELKYDGLRFEIGEIKDYNDANEVDMVVTLHACDTATDDALAKAVGWGAKVILSVPCCQHELFSKIKNETMNPMLKHGLIKERLSALITDSIRVKLLETIGYNVAVVEFIDIEHTPKNLMIKAIKTSEKKNEESLKEYKKFAEFWGVTQHLEKQLLK